MVINRGQQATDTLFQKFQRPIAAGCDDGLATGHGLGNDIAKRFMTGRADQHVCPTDHRLRIILPSQKMDTFGNAKLIGKRGKRLTFRAFACQPQRAVIKLCKARSKVSKALFT